VRPGEKIGLVGRSGAGKSTLVNLLLRFFDLESGRILIDGQDIAAVSQESLRTQISMVTQDTSLLHRSIRDNIRYGRPDASESEIIAAAQMAHAHEFIVDLEDWKGHRGSRRGHLCAGQRGGGCHSIKPWYAHAGPHGDRHRAPSVHNRPMDRLIVLDRGRIVEQGTHDELLGHNGHYATLWRRQSGGFIDVADQQAAE
jgi:ATP-binding cassette, subfamily B, multidrug efflux pump